MNLIHSVAVLPCDIWQIIGKSLKIFLPLTQCLQWAHSVNIYSISTSFLQIQTLFLKWIYNKNSTVSGWCGLCKRWKVKKKQSTRMDSSPMRTARCSCRLGGRGVCQGGVSAWGMYTPLDPEADTPFWTQRQTPPTPPSTDSCNTDSCKNIAFPLLLLQTVKIVNYVNKLNSWTMDEVHKERT